MASKMTKGYVGWRLPEHERARLLQLFPAQFERVIAHHITFKFGVSSDHELPTQTRATVIAQVVDPEGVQALVVSVGGKTDRPDGGTLHITWSLAQGRKPVQSNQVILTQEWQPLPSIQFEIQPEFFPY